MPHSKKPPYCISIPPPNVTGVLHMGHALVDTLQDVLIRWKRMSGFEALWVPGTDHAGIATQTVVERNFIATRQAAKGFFPGRVSLPRLGLEREERRTDPKSAQEARLLLRLVAPPLYDGRAAQSRRPHLFKKMFDEGLIYRGDYLVNWDPVTQTALADDEVEHEERDSFLWYFRYPLEERVVTSWSRRPALKRCSEIQPSPSPRAMSANSS